MLLDPNLPVLGTSHAGEPTVSDFLPGRLFTKQSTFTLIHRESRHPEEHRPAVLRGQHGVGSADPPLPHSFFRTVLTPRARPSLSPDTVPLRADKPTRAIFTDSPLRQQGLYSHQSFLHLFFPSTNSWGPRSGTNGVPAHLWDPDMEQLWLLAG